MSNEENYRNALEHILRAATRDAYQDEAKTLTEVIKLAQFALADKPIPEPCDIWDVNDQLGEAS